MLDRIPTGRLVVLGEPGSGKTVLLLRLVLDLLARRDAGGPVPLLVPVASWNPDQDGLYDWLETQMIREHPWLASTSATGVSRAHALLTAGLVLPVLDGLDEIRSGGRGRALVAINETLRHDTGLVLSCRATAFRHAVRPGPLRQPVHLEGAAGIRLTPLDPAAIATYLTETAGADGPSRWAPVRAALATSPTPPVARALCTPLMASLARTIYNPRQASSTLGLPDPAELCDTAAFPTRAAVEEHLFDGLIAAVYRPRSTGTNRWTAAQATPYLIFLARHLEHRLRTTSLAWWELPRALPRAVMPLAVGLTVGLVAGLAFGLAFGPAAGLADGLGAGLGAGLAIRLEDGLGAGLTIRLTVGLMAGLMAGLVFGLAGGLVVGLVAGLAGGLVFGLAFGLVVGLGSSSPRHIILRWPRLSDLATGLTTGLTVGLVGGLAFGFAAGLVGGLTVGLAAGLAAGVATGLGFGLAVGLAAGLGMDTTVDTQRAAGPGAVLIHDRASGLIGGLVGGLVVGLVGGLAFGLAAGLMDGAAAGAAVGAAAGLAAGAAVGLAAGAAVGLVGGLASVWGRLGIARLWLACRGHQPLRLMAFLADAHDRGILRQAGAVWEFRHANLQRRLASHHHHRA